MLWQVKNNEGAYVTMKTPSSYKIDWEDIDSNSYRSVSNGNLVRSRLSSKWFKGGFNFNYLTESELEEMLTLINQNPLYVKVKSPMFGTNGVIEIEAYVAKVSVDMMRNDTTNNNEQQWVNLSFNIIQSKVVSGQ